MEKIHAYIAASIPEVEKMLADMKPLSDRFRAPLVEKLQKYCEDHQARFHKAEDEVEFAKLPYCYIISLTGTCYKRVESYRPMESTDSND